MDYDEEEEDEKLSGNSGTNSPADSSIIKAVRTLLLAHHLHTYYISD